MAVYKQLNDRGTECYKTKLKMIGLDEDPYYVMAKSEWSTSRNLWPCVDFPDIYYIHLKHSCTHNQV